MANIIVPVTKIEAPFHGINIASAGVGGQSSTAGTAEIFEATFPAINESCYFIVTNGNTATVQCKVLSNGAPGYVESNYTMAKNGMVVIGVDPSYMKQADGTVQIKLTPNSATTITVCGCKVYAFYDYDTDALSGAYRWVDYGQLNDDLEDIADAIRTVTGGTSKLNFPTDFISAIESMQSGGEA